MYQNRLFSFSHGLIAVSDSVSVEVSEKERAAKRCGKQNKAGLLLSFQKRDFLLQWKHQNPTERGDGMAGINIPVGISDFEKIRRNGYYYVDKTGLIPELLRVRRRL